MKPLKKKDLIEAGWPRGPQLVEMLDKVRELQERGVCDRKYLFKLLSRDYGAPEPKAKMREKAAPFTEAIQGETKEEKENIEAVRQQMDGLLKVPVIQKGAVMPDACPASRSPAVIPVGGVIAVENAIIPSAHSADVCCSMFASFYEKRSEVSEELDALVSSTRFGPGGRHYDDLVPHEVMDEEVWDNPFLSGLRERGVIHIADQGDGNHFSFLGEVTVDEEFVTRLREVGYQQLASELEGEKVEGKEKSRTLRVLVTHHGSRSLGAHLYKRGQGVALKQTEKAAQHVPKAGAWIDMNSDEGHHYWEALQYVGRWTRANHEAIHKRFLERIQADKVAAFGNEHNFVWKRGDTFFHGKGATPAWKDKGGRPLLGLIPLNMAEPILMVLGGDQEEFLSFAPHGAGRNVSRTKLMRRYPDLATRRNVLAHHTQGIDVRWYCGQPDLSESPVGYKNAEQVREQIKHFGLAEVVAEIRPLGCIMAGSSGRSWKEMKDEQLTPKQKRQIVHRADRRRTKQDLGQWED